MKVGDKLKFINEGFTIIIAAIGNFGTYEVKTDGIGCKLWTFKYLNERIRKNEIEVITNDLVINDYELY